MYVHLLKDSASMIQFIEMFLSFLWKFKEKTYQTFLISKNEKLYTDEVQADVNEWHVTVWQYDRSI